MAKRPTGSLVGPYDTSESEAKGHFDNAPLGPKKADGKFVGPYDTSKEEANGHGDGRAAKGNDGKTPHAGI